MTDILDQLRAWADENEERYKPMIITEVVMCRKAAAEIERLRKASAGEPAPQVSPWQPIDLTERLKDTLASLVAAISLLKRSSKKAAPSDKMFDQMIVDYERSVERARKALAALPAPPSVEAIPHEGTK